MSSEKKTRGFLRAAEELWTSQVTSPPEYWWCQRSRRTYRQSRSANSSYLQTWRRLEIDRYLAQIAELFRLAAHHLRKRDTEFWLVSKKVSKSTSHFSGDEMSN
jgi:hypothetical protein